MLAGDTIYDLFFVYLAVKHTTHNTPILGPRMVIQRIHFQLG